MLVSSLMWRHRGVHMQRRRRIAIAAVVLVVSGGCASKTTTTSGANSGIDTGPAAKPASADQLAALATALKTPSCDELDTSHCLLPFPSSRFQAKDSSTPTGVRIHLPQGQLANDKGTALDVTDWNRNDGFSPGTPILFSAPNVDLVASKAPPIGDIGQSLGEASATVLLDMTSSTRLAHWVEIDSNAPAGKQLVIVRPAAALPEGHRIVLGVRHLVDHAGAALAASPAFTVYRDNLTTDLPPIESRRPSMNEAFGALDRVDVVRSSLFLTVDFIVASAKSLSDPILTMRDDAFRRLGDKAPTYTADPVITTGLPKGIARRLTGTFSVPVYLTDGGKPGSRLNRDATTGLPKFGDGEWKANFTCQIPQVALDAVAGATRPVVYGHGLLGGADESQNSQVAKIASTDNMAYCATDWIGMSQNDLGTAASVLGDLSLFPEIPDRTLQGILDTLFLGRLMIHHDGFAKDPAFQNSHGASILDTKELYFDGNSQGAIIGGAATAVALDWHKAVLGVPGMDFALLLSRSVDFSQYFAILRNAYPDPVDQQIIYPILQMLWDRGETNGYAQHLTKDPYPGTSAHRVILDVAFGDHQVSQYAAEMEARTIGARLRSPALADGRSADPKPFYGIETIGSYPYDGSALIYYDSGVLAPPTGNVTPVQSEAYKAQCGAMTKDQLKASGPCHDPHEDPRRAPQSIQQKDGFFRPDGTIADLCGAQPCATKNEHELDY